MRKVNRKELEALQRDGVTVKRTMGSEKPMTGTAPKPMEGPNHKAAMASMEASQKYLAAQLSALAAAVSLNTDMLGALRDELKKAAEKSGKTKK